MALVSHDEEHRPAEGPPSPGRQEGLRAPSRSPASKATASPEPGRRLAGVCLLICSRSPRTHPLPGLLQVPASGWSGPLGEHETGQSTMGEALHPLHPCRPHQLLQPLHLHHLHHPHNYLFSPHQKYKLKITKEVEKNTHSWLLLKCHFTQTDLVPLIRKERACWPTSQAGCRADPNQHQLSSGGTPAQHCISLR